MGSRWEEYKKKNGVTPLDALNPLRQKTSIEEAYERHSICSGCDRYIRLIDQCKECGCFMRVKTSLKAAKCPLGKW